MNKIIVSILLTLILILGINKIVDTIYNVDKPEKSAYQIASITGASSDTNSEASSQDESAQDIMALFASTSSADGEKVFKKCAACHSISKGGKNKIGPALWGIMGRQSGSLTDFKYSKAMTNHGKIWSFEEMNGFLLKPKDWIEGTKMSFAGLKKPKERAAVILYLNENSDDPLPLQ